jgi:hypothetical protein
MVEENAISISGLDPVMKLQTDVLLLPHSMWSEVWACSHIDVEDTMLSEAEQASVWYEDWD